MISSVEYNPEAVQPGASYWHLKLTSQLSLSECEPSARVLLFASLLLFICPSDLVKAMLRLIHFHLFGGFFKALDKRSKAVF